MPPIYCIPRAKINQCEERRGYHKMPSIFISIAASVNYNQSQTVTLGFLMQKCCCDHFLTTHHFLTTIHALHFKYQNIFWNRTIISSLESNQIIVQNIIKRIPEPGYTLFCNVKSGYYLFCDANQAPGSGSKSQPSDSSLTRILKVGLLFQYRFVNTLFTCDTRHYVSVLLSVGMPVFLTKIHFGHLYFVQVSKLNKFSTTQRLSLLLPLC